tara:strand:+ start:42 stop:707 length:666 start_codon:yes stop_codon:yes gene_type:complete
MQRKNKNIKQIFFDLDGTLLDTAPQFHLALSNLIEIRGGEQVIFQDVRDLVSDGVNALIKLAFKISGKNKDFNLLRNELLTEYSKNYLESALFKGTEELIKTLNEKKITWGVVTNKPKYLSEKIFETLKWHELTDILICPQDVGEKRKPDPSSLLKAIESGGFSPEETVYVGDNWRDSEASMKAKTNFIFANYGYGDASSIDIKNLKTTIDSPLEILKIFN